jgi:hypothetical protein
VFKPDPTITWVPALREQVVAVVESINQPQVSIPGKAPQQVSGHLVGIRNGNGSFSIYVALHLPKVGENVVYVHDQRQLGGDAYREIEVEGVQFLESMGFMLDDLNFRNLAAAAQDEILKRIPLLKQPQGKGPAAEAAPAAAPRPAAQDAGRVARLLASF